MLALPQRGALARRFGRTRAVKANNAHGGWWRALYRYHYVGVRTAWLACFDASGGVWRNNEHREPVLRGGNRLVRCGMVYSSLQPEPFASRFMTCDN